MKISNNAITNIIEIGDVVIPIGYNEENGVSDDLLRLVCKSSEYNMVQTMSLDSCIMMTSPMPIDNLRSQYKLFARGDRVKLVIE